MSKTETAEPEALNGAEAPAPAPEAEPARGARLVYHLRTVIQTTYVVGDEHGNAEEVVLAPVELRRVSPDDLLQVMSYLEAQRARLQSAP